jgi:hypothetical protein
MGGQEAHLQDILLKIQEKQKSIIDSLDDEFRRNSCL